MVITAYEVGMTCGDHIVGEQQRPLVGSQCVRRARWALTPGRAVCLTLALPARIAVVFSCYACICLIDDPQTAPRSDRSRRPKDRAEVVQSRDDGVDLRRRSSSSRPDAAPGKPGGSYPLLPGYSGIEITHS